MKECLVCSARTDGKFCSRTCYMTYPMVIERDRFWAAVQKTETCWVWTGRKNDTGYGQFWAASQMLELAHRSSWRLARGPIPSGMLVLHECDNRPCVRPDHLFLGTNLENNADCRAKGRAHKGTGEKNGRSKLTDLEVEQIRAAYIPGKVQMSELGRRFGVSGGHISQILSGRVRGNLNKFVAGASSGSLGFGA